MKLLVVDDQINVVNGILNNIPFAEIGFTKVRSTTNAMEALRIMEETSIDILLTDIEMPKMNGLELIVAAKEKHPAILCILLTSHTLFSYAQESIKLGCFDYIVQPAPYEVIEDSLRNAVNTLRIAQETQIERGYGKLFKSYEREFINSSIMKLYSQNSKDVRDGQNTLYDYGYHIYDTSAAQLLFINLFANSTNAATYPSQNYVLTVISSALRQSMGRDSEEPEIEYLISAQPHRQYSILAIWNTSDAFQLRFSKLEDFYNSLCGSVHAVPVACYVSDVFCLPQLHDVAEKIRGSMRENITKQTGLFFCGGGDKYVEIPTSFAAYQNRWSNLLESDQRYLLKKDILDFINGKIIDASNRYQKLCELHQFLIQMFFRHFYDKGIEISSLFREDYTYQDCMEAYSTVEDLENLLDFLIGSLDAGAVEEKPFDYIEKAKSYIMDNINYMLTVKDVAAHVHLNPEYFTRVFKKEMGVGIKEYIIRCKISLAKDLLKNSNLPVYMISLELGYSNFSYFVQLFKQEENMTPLEYREQNRKKA